MAQIPSYSDAGTLQATDWFVVDRGGVTFKVAGSGVYNYLSSAIPAVHNTPVNDDIDNPISSNWAYDHLNDNTNIHLDWTQDQGATNIHPNNITGLTTTLEALTDTTITTPGDGEVLTYHPTQGWVNETPSTGVTTLSALDDTSVSTPSDDQALVYHPTTGWTNQQLDHTTFSNIGSNTHAQIDTHIGDSTIHFTKSSINIEDLGNVDTAGVTDAQVLTYHPTQGWVPETPSTGVTTLEALTDTTITTVGDGELLQYDNGTGKWINQTLAEAGVAATSHNHDSSYISIVSTPTTGNFPQLTAGGELVNSAYDETSFATAGHTHDTFDRATSVLVNTNVFSDIIVTDGITTGISTRTLLLSDFASLASEQRNQTVFNNLCSDGTFLFVSDIDASPTQNDWSDPIASGWAYTHSVTNANQHIDWTSTSSNLSTTGKLTANQLFLNEQSAATTDVPGDGQFWVKTATPNLPMFTDDAGNDFYLLEKEFIVAVGDENTDITTGNAKVTFRMPYTMIVTELRASLTSSGTGTTTIDVNETGVTMMSTNKITILTGQTYSKDGGATQPGITNNQLDDGDVITIDIDAAATGATGLKVYFIGYKIA